MSGSAFAVTHHAFSSGAGRTSDGNGSHASTLKSPSYTKSVSWQHYRSVVLQPVPPHTTAAGVPARIVGKPDSDKPSMDMDQHFNGINHTFEYGDGI